jgi:hypothetical protein
MRVSHANLRALLAPALALFLIVLGMSVPSTAAPHRRSSGSTRWATRRLRQTRLPDVERDRDWRDLLRQHGGDRRCGPPVVGGNEIAGHTLHHDNIKPLKVADARLEVCQDRVNLFDHATTCCEPASKPPKG